MLHPRALDGWFRYNVTVGGQQVVREVNVLDLARANGQLAATDPTVMRTLDDINARLQKTGAVNAVERSAAQQLHLAEPGEPGRAPAGDPHRLQHRARTTG